MAQASPEFQRFLHHLSDAAHPILRSNHSRQLRRILKATKGWFLGLMGLLLLLIWNWQLVVSGGAGIAAMVAVYLLLQKQLSLPPVKWQVLWKPANRSLTLSLVTGGITWFSLYLTLCIWQETGGSWLAKGVILQGLGILAILLLLTWQRLEARDDRPTNSPAAERWLAELTDPDPLKRLIAVRRLVHAVQTTAQNSTAALLSPTELADCFRLMLNRETEPIVCRALVEGLQGLKPDRQLSPSSSPPLAPSDLTASCHQKLKLDRSENL